MSRNFGVYEEELDLDEPGPEPEPEPEPVGGVTYARAANGALYVVK